MKAYPKDKGVTPIADSRHYARHLAKAGVSEIEFGLGGAKSPENVKEILNILTDRSVEKAQALLEKRGFKVEITPKNTDWEEMGLGKFMRAHKDNLWFIAGAVFLYSTGKAIEDKNLLLATIGSAVAGVSSFYLTILYRNQRRGR
ncbi:hypothetical protein HZB08_01235 [Candidatus Saganbacteria bacterium]|uniref:Uncharacterized protein n=1 Tax=Candidatus Saganbacteria bacterium TaxID=2575572 RepID=A0A9D6YVU7_UNCSA|nr:hypothetical protein [Candidatus Saganbacteria bacterium]